MNGYRISVRYGFVRSRQLEGTYPGDKQTGTWPITSHRVSYGWGDPPEESWPYGAGWLAEEPPGIDLIAKKHRFFRPYKRVRTIAACERAARDGVMVSLDITDKWANPRHGQIPAPSPNDISLPTMHHVLLIAFNPDRNEFKFMNSWGPSWGDAGYGYIRSGRLAATWCEAWQCIPKPTSEWLVPAGSPDLKAGKLEQADGTILHWVEIVDGQDERLGWGSAVQSQVGFEIEEIFVRPIYRRRGLGRKLFQTLETSAQNLRLPIKMWISFADTARHNLDVIDRITGRSGLVIQPSGVRWAPLVSAPPRDSLAGPVSSFPYPRVPPSAPNELVRLATEVAIGLGTGVASAFIYDAFKSWLDPENGKRIKVRLKDMEISTSEVSADDFRKIMKELQNIKEETEIKTKITKTGIDVKITRRSQNVSDDQS